MQEATEGLKKTPLFDVYSKYGGRIVEFGGWALPVQFSGILDEHKAVREKAGLFDVSHMGEIEIIGPRAAELVQLLLTNDISQYGAGHIMYSPMCYPHGGVADDLLVYKFDENRYMLVVNAANTQKDYEWITDHVMGGTAVGNVSPQIAQVAVQGPESGRILSTVTKADILSLDYYEFLQDTDIAGIKCLVSRTGYTGEDGFELYCDAHNAVRLWEELLEAGHKRGMKPCGLGARDVLRFEACMPLYGHEISDAITPLEAGLGRFVKLDKAGFIGREALARQKESGLKRKLAGFKMVDRGVARAGYPVRAGGKDIGFVTSGSYSPSLNQNLGMALVETGHDSPGSKVSIVIRDKEHEAEVTARPFYKRR